MEDIKYKAAFAHIIICKSQNKLSALELTLLSLQPNHNYFFLNSAQITKQQNFTRFPTNDWHNLPSLAVFQYAGKIKACQSKLFDQNEEPI